MDIRAAVLTAPGKYEVQEFAYPQLQNGALLRLGRQLTMRVQAWLFELVHRAIPAERQAG